MNLLPYSKAIVALIVPAILAGLSALGVTADMRVEDALGLIITGIVTAIAVYFVPNKKARK